MKTSKFWNLASLVASTAIQLCVAPSFAQTAGEIEERQTVIMSEGVRLHADLFYPKSDSPRALPTIVMSHGWGGTAAMLRGYASDFARAGYFVIAFDYRGWGRSDSRVILTAPPPEQKSGIRFSAEVREVREVVDPLEQATDILNVIHWAMAEPMVDKPRLGLWGTSFSGGLVVYVAARDPRVRAIVSQVGWMGQAVGSMPPPWRDKNHEDATRRARGELPYPDPGVRELGNLRGAPIREKFLLYAPVEDVSRIEGCAMLFISAEKEELFDNREHPQLAYERAAEPKKHVVIPNIAHYGIYNEAREQATKLAIEWFDEHLKN